MYCNKKIVLSLQNICISIYGIDFTEIHETLVRVMRKTFHRMQYDNRYVGAIPMVVKIMVEKIFSFYNKSCELFEIYINTVEFLIHVNMYNSN